MHHFPVLRIRGTIVWLCLTYGLAAFGLMGCGGSGNSGGGGGPTAPTPFVVLTPDDGAPPAVILRQGAGTSGADLELEIVANELQNVKTVDFVLAYPAQLMTLVDARSGPFLGTAPSAQFVALSGNQLQVSLTRLEIGGAAGTDVLAVMSFQGIAAGNGRIDFIGPVAGSPDGLEIQGIVWMGAGIQVSP